MDAAQSLSLDPVAARADVVLETATSTMVVRTAFGTSLCGPALDRRAGSGRRARGVRYGIGTVKDPEQFKALYAYSPYHHVVDGTKYPAILMMTGANDGRVAPYHSRKMVARLDEANKSSAPILLRTSSSAGHGIGTALSERIKQSADIYSFLFAQLEMRPH